RFLKIPRQLEVFSRDRRNPRQGGQAPEDEHGPDPGGALPVGTPYRRAPMAAKKWLRLPGGLVKRWKKSGGDDRPSGAVDQVPPHWYRNRLNRRERRRVFRAVHRGEAEA